MRALALLLTLGACSYEPRAADQDGPPEGDGPLDPDGPDPDGTPDSFVGPEPTACVASFLSGVLPVFSTPAFVGRVGQNSINFETNERDPFVSADQHRLYYSLVNAGDGDADIFVAFRSGTSGPFNTPAFKISLSDTTEDSKVTMTENELIAFIASRRSGGQGETDLWEARRGAGGDDGFDPMTQEHLMSVNTGGNQLDPHVSPDGLRLYLAINDPQQIAASSRASLTTAFSIPTVIPNLGTGADPALTADERVIIFSSNRANGLGGTDLYYAVRAQRDLPFGPPTPLGINTQHNDADPDISADGCTLTFASTRAVGNDDFDLYFSIMTP